MSKAKDRFYNKLKKAGSLTREDMANIHDYITELEAAIVGYQNLLEMNMGLYKITTKRLEQEKAELIEFVIEDIYNK
jgi:hypothetical protein